jgi:hypothetical protein
MTPPRESVLEVTTEGRSHLVRAAALELAGVLSELLEVLVAASQPEVAWLRPLAAALVDLELAASDSPGLNTEALAAAHRFASGLLWAKPHDPGNFASRYRRRQRGSTRVSTLHRRAVVACGNLALQLSWLSGERHAG